MKVEITRPNAVEYDAKTLPDGSFALASGLIVKKIDGTIYAAGGIPGAYHGDELKFLPVEPERIAVRSARIPVSDWPAGRFAFQGPQLFLKRGPDSFLNMHNLQPFTYFCHLSDAKIELLPADAKIKLSTGKREFLPEYIRPKKATYTFQSIPVNCVGVIAKTAIPDPRSGMLFEKLPDGRISVIGKLPPGITDLLPCTMFNKDLEVEIVPREDLVVLAEGKTSTSLPAARLGVHKKTGEPVIRFGTSLVSLSGHLGFSEFDEVELLEPGTVIRLVL